VRSSMIGTRGGVIWVAFGLVAIVRHWSGL
jgi:hypothetical protein